MQIDKIWRKLPVASALVTTAVLNTKICEAENKIQDIGGLVTTIVLNIKIGEAENKIPDISGLVKKTDCNTKMSGIEAKHFTTSDYNKFASEVVEAKIKGKNWLESQVFLISLKSFGLITKLVTFATKASLKAGQDKIVKLQVFNSSYFHGKSHFEDTSQKLLIAIIFQLENQKDCLIKVVNLLLHLIKTSSCSFKLY